MSRERDGDPDEREGESQSQQEALLRNEVRARIVRELGRTPGLNKNQLRERLDVHPNLVQFHVERLEEGGLVVTKPSAQGKEVLCFREEDTHLWEDESTRILFGRRRSRQVALYVSDNPGAPTSEIAAFLDLSPVTVRHHLRTLIEHDLVERVRLGRKVEYHPQPRLQDWDQALGDRYERPWTGVGTGAGPPGDEPDR